MARRKQDERKRTPSEDREEAAEVIQTTEGVVVLWRDYVLPPEQPPASADYRRRCPRCGWGPATSRERYAADATSYYYFCRRCADPDARPTGPTRWKEAR